MQMHSKTISLSRTWRVLCAESVPRFHADEYKSLVPRATNGLVFFFSLENFTFVCRLMNIYEALSRRSVSCEDGEGRCDGTRSDGCCPRKVEQCAPLVARTTVARVAAIGRLAGGRVARTNGDSVEPPLEKDRKVNQGNGSITRTDLFSLVNDRSAKDVTRSALKVVIDWPLPRGGWESRGACQVALLPDSTSIDLFTDAAIDPARCSCHYIAIGRGALLGAVATGHFNLTAFYL